MGKEKSKLKYYIYISDTKLDMLYEQIPVGTRDSLATELKIDFKFLSTTLKEEAAEGRRTRMAKLGIVSEFIDNNEPVGTIDNPKAYFRGSTMLSWAFSQEVRNAVIFSGISKESLLVLGGSSKHMLGASKSDSLNVVQQRIMQSSSTLYALLDVLSNDELLLEGNEILDDVKFGARSFTHYPVYAAIIALIYTWGLSQKVEFLAKRLFEENAEFNSTHEELLNYLDAMSVPDNEIGQLKDSIFESGISRVIFGTPIYIALSE